MDVDKNTCSNHPQKPSGELHYEAPMTATINHDTTQSHIDFPTNQKAFDAEASINAKPKTDGKGDHLQKGNTMTSDGQHEEDKKAQNTSLTAVNHTGHPTAPSSLRDTSISAEDAQKEIYRLASLHGLDLSVLAKKRVELLDQHTAEIVTPSKNISLFYLPTQIRLKIYRLLLVNPALGKAPVVDYKGPSTNFHEWEWPWRRTKYGLAPFILRVSKRVYGEALGCLYSENKFYVDFNERPVYSPLSRFLGEKSRASKFSFQNLPATIKVQHWHICVAIKGHSSSYLGSAKLNENFLEDFSQSVARASPRSIVVVVRDASDRETWSTEIPIDWPRYRKFEVDFQNFHCQNQFQRLLNPLRALSGIEQVSIQIKYSHNADPYKYPAENTHFIGQLTNSMTRKTTEVQELAFEMFGPLLRTMRTVSCALVGNQLAEFKRQRALVLQDMEAHYREVTATWSIVKTILNYHKEGYSWILNSDEEVPEYEGITRRCTDHVYEAVVGSVEECINAWTRRFPSQTVEELKNVKVYEGAKENRIFRKLKLVLKECEAPFERDEVLRDTLPVVIELLQTWFTELRTAREALFEFDHSEQPGCDTELQIEGLDEILSGKFCNCESYSHLYWPNIPRDEGMEENIIS
ncbi:hypothetical protein HYALB_00003300 [Hymenoscyphus albidus]|uniref:Uncharacterized protein n=1 Tax=Hymenoscyphus albidus TaxID=595503 RepID=A0A9N9LGL9_9HELO|nr:hypothetical protein HYALB_00003300 [Hymenoscyphus albidus]